MEFKKKIMEKKHKRDGKITIALLLILKKSSLKKVLQCIEFNF